jgi:RNA polymerase sigma factor (sigma-70 family)
MQKTFIQWQRTQTDEDFQKFKTQLDNLIWFQLNKCDYDYHTKQDRYSDIIIRVFEALPRYDVSKGQITTFLYPHITAGLRTIETDMYGIPNNAFYFCSRLYSRNPEPSDQDFIDEMKAFNASWTVNTIRMYFYRYIDKTHVSFDGMEDWKKDELCNTNDDFVSDIETQDLIDKLMSRLTQKEKDVIKMRFFEDKKFGDIRKALNYNTTQAVKQTYDRGMEKMKKMSWVG